jgi:hypothetical protein
MGFEEAGSDLILTRVQGVLPAIDFDDQLGRARYEIADVGADDDLAVEADAVELAIA